MIDCRADRGDGLFHPCCSACDVLGCWYTRSAGGIDKADAARSEPSPVGDATTIVGPPLTVDEVLAGRGLPIEVARSMLAAVSMGRTRQVSDRLWMRLLVTYIDICDDLVDQAIEDARSALTADHGPSRECSNGPDCASGGER